MHELCEYTKGEGFSEGFDAHLNIEQMNKASAELFQLYDDHRKKGISVPSEKEFRGYYALLKLDRHPGYKVFFRFTQILLLWELVYHKLETVTICSANCHLFHFTWLAGKSEMTFVTFGFAENPTSGAMQLLIWNMIVGKSIFSFNVLSTLMQRNG